MSKIVFKLIVVLFFFFSCSEKKEITYWPEVNNESKPWTRWWWLGSAVDEQNINRLLKEYAQIGIGGVEITPIYGVKGEEANYLEFLSPEWVKMLQATVDAAHTNKMAVDMNTGTGWPFGGPGIEHEFAAKKMEFQQLGNITHDALQQFTKQVSENHKVDLLALSAYNSNERINLLTEDSLIYKSKEKDWRVIAVTQRNTAQKVKRAAPGGEGLVFNHFSEEATNHYLESFTRAFKGNNPGIRCFFNDSYELSKASGQKNLFETFEKLKGYDLALYAKELSGVGNESDISRIKADYREVLGQMLLHNFTQNWTNWAKGLGAQTRNQAHGSPGNLIDLYAAVGIPELETFHSTNFPFLQSYINQSDARHTESNQLFKKFASSAAHIQGKRLVSCETFTWLNEHFKTPLYQCKPELDELFVKGVNHLFFHGTAYSPQRAKWPGWLFYASIHIEPNNPQWQHMVAMNDYISRCQSVLQHGQHTNDFWVYWSPDNYNHNSSGLEKKLTLHNSEQWVNMPEVDELLHQAYQFDFVSDLMIEKLKTRNGKLYYSEKCAYKTIVIPRTERIKWETFQKLLELAEQGASIIFSNLPTTVSGFKDYRAKEAELAKWINSQGFTQSGAFKQSPNGKGRIIVGNVENALQELGVERETLIDYKLKTISRETDNGVYYFIANHEKEKIDKHLGFKHHKKNVVFMNPMNGKLLQGKVELGKVRIVLEPGASTILYFTNDEVRGLEQRTYLQPDTAIELSNTWTLSVVRGGPEHFDEEQLPEPKFWTDVAGSEKRHFAGTCAYSTSFEMDNLEASEYLLRFDKVEASAKVFLNNKEVATLWSFPFELEVGKFLKKGNNTLKVEVPNLGGNRIRHMDLQGIDWKKFKNINIVDLNYKALDATSWSVLPSGLSGSVHLVPLN